MTIVVVNPEESNVVFIKFTPVNEPNFIEKLENDIQLIIKNHGTFLIHLDLKGMNITYLTKQRHWIEEVIKTHTDSDYTKYLEEIQIYNAPSIMGPLYSIISRIVDKELLKEKLKIIPKENGIVKMAGKVATKATQVAERAGKVISEKTERVGAAITNVFK